MSEKTIGYIGLIGLGALLGWSLLRGRPKTASELEWLRLIERYNLSKAASIMKRRRE